MSTSGRIRVENTPSSQNHSFMFSRLLDSLKWFSTKTIASLSKRGAHRTQPYVSPTFGVVMDTLDTRTNKHHQLSLREVALSFPYRKSPGRESRQGL